VGVGARKRDEGDEFFLEVAVLLCRHDSDIEALERSVALLKLLRTRGYSLTAGDGYVICELTAAAGGLAREETWILSTVRELLNED
jgi:hypothetical protein